MPNWNQWLSFEGIEFAFPHLRAMELHDCPELRGHLPGNLPCIEKIVISGCSHLLEIPSTLHWLSSIKKMNIDGHGERTQLSLLESGSLCMMEDVVIEECAKLLYVPKLILRSTCLTQLKLHYLSSLTAFPSSGLPTSLQSLHIQSCKNLSFLPLETWSNYTSLVSLTLWSSCDALASFPLDGFPALLTFRIYYCRSVDSIYILESPSHRLLSLQSLYIQSHDSIGLFKVKLRMDTLTALEELSLVCEGELSFCEGVCLPPKLQSISILSYGTTRPVTEWGLQDLTHISSLEIGKGDDIVNTSMKEMLLPISLVTLVFRQLDKMKSFGGNGIRHLSYLQKLSFGNSHQLESLSENCHPSSLKSLRFWACKKLESFYGNGFRDLSSLKNLNFGNCYQLESLPENCLPSSLKTLYLSDCPRLKALPEDSLPDSLTRLIIERCPALEERYKRKEHWSKIAHIPVININGQVTI